jgi:alkaline phosphatase
MKLHSGMMPTFTRFMPLAAVIVAGCASNGGMTDAKRPARNVILFLGDGMGVSTVTAARIFDGQSRGETGEENSLSFETFPHVALVKTYNSNQQVPDSAGTATAILTGTKTRAGVINIGPEARRRNCDEGLANRLPTFAEVMAASGKSVGVVTTTRVTHATPAAVYAQSVERDWESDACLPAQAAAAGCRDIAAQLTALPPGQGPDIVLGGGLREFRGSDSGGKRRTAGQDLVADWLAASGGRRLIQSREALADLDPGEQVLGLFAESHMTYIAEREDPTSEPTIQEMTAAAIDYLQARGEGYYLLVEGGRIDHGHHDGYPGYALLETQAFADAVAIALDKVDLAETLVLVTADHSHVFTHGGYPTRGNPILGLVVENDHSGEPRGEPHIAADGQPYTSVGYMNGPGAVSGPRPRPETGVHAMAQALIPFERTDIAGEVSNSETHGGEDVALYAIGPGSDRVGGVMEQSRIYGIIMDAFGQED